MFISCIFAIFMGNVFNLCDIWNKTDWIYKSVSLWESFVALWGLRAKAATNTVWTEASCWWAAVRRGMMVWFPRQDPKGWELASRGFKQQMAFQKSWLDVGVLKLPGKGFSPSGGGWRGCATVGLGEHLGHGGGFEGELEVSKMWGGGGSGALSRSGMQWRWTFNSPRSGVQRRWERVMQWALPFVASWMEDFLAQSGTCVAPQHKLWKKYY